MKISRKTAERLAKTMGIDTKKIPVDEFYAGLKVELEHGTVHKDTDVTNNNLFDTGKIALAHLREIPDYYKRLDKMEKNAKKSSKKRVKNGKD